ENGVADKSMEIYLPPGQARTFTAPKLAAGKTSAQLKLNGAEGSFDDVTYYVAPEFDRASIAWFGRESVNDPEKLRFYIERLFAGPGQKVEVVRPYTNSAFSAEMLGRSGLAIIAEKLAPE